MTMTHEERVARLRTMVDEGRVLRGAWTEGRGRTSLLGALSPEAGDAQSASACPASVMPGWLAYLTPNMEDRGTRAAWPAMVRRYADLAARWHVLDESAWERARVATLLVIVREARSHVASDQAATLTAIDGVIAWLEAGAPEADRERVAAAALAAEAAAGAAAGAAAALAAAWVAWAVAWAGAASALAAAWAAVAAEAEAAAAAWAAVAAEAEAAAAAWDRITASVLDAIEAECERAEVTR